MDIGVFGRNEGDNDKCNEGARDQGGIGIPVGQNIADYAVDLSQY